MDIKCRISIITVCFNSENTLERAIKSVLDQAYPDVEYIIIDGGSTDGTVEIIQKYDAGIAYWVSEPDQGIYNAMNKGIRAATGDLIAFLSSNDWYEKDALGKVAERYIETGSDVIYGDVTFVDGNKMKRQSYMQAKLEDFYYYMPVVHPVLFVKASLQKRYMFDETYHIAADYKFYMQIYHEGYRFSYVNANIAYYCLGGISSLRKSETLGEGRKAAYEVLKDQSKLYKEGIEEAYLREMLIHDTTPLLNNGFSARWIEERIDVKENIYLFGTGEMAERCFRHLKNADRKLTCWIDNDINKQGRLLHGLEIKAPHILKNVNKGTVFITSTRYSEEIDAQIRNMNLGLRVIDSRGFFGEMVEDYIVEINERNK